MPLKTQPKPGTEKVFMAYLVNKFNWRLMDKCEPRSFICGLYLLLFNIIEIKRERM